jgi:hypothetical protein
MDERSPRDEPALEAEGTIRDLDVPDEQANDVEGGSASRHSKYGDIELKN